MALYTDTHALVNQLYSEITGKEALANIDTAALVDIGKELKNATTADSLYGKIIDKVGKVVILNKLYKGKVPTVLRDSWEWGSILEDIRVKPFEAAEDPSNNPTAGKYDDFLQYAPADIAVKYFTDYIDFQFKHWKPNDQLWTAFRNFDEMDRFIGGIETSIANSLTVRLQGLIKATIANYIAQVANSANTTTYINVLELYNAVAPATVSADDALHDAGFLRFFVETVMNTEDRFVDMSSVFNLAGEDEFTNEEDVNFVVLSTVANAIKVNMQSDTYHADLVSLPNYESVPYWQAAKSATGTYDFDTISKINAKIKVVDPETEELTTKDVEVDGVLAVMFDRDALGINCEKRKTTTFYHPDLDQTKFYDKYRAQYFNRLDKNFVVFYIADADAEGGGE